MRTRFLALCAVVSLTVAGPTLAADVVEAMRQLNRHAELKFVIISYSLAMIRAGVGDNDVDPRVLALDGAMKEAFNSAQFARSLELGDQVVTKLESEAKRLGVTAEANEYLQSKTMVDSLAFSVFVAAQVEGVPQALAKFERLYRTMDAWTKEPERWGPEEVCLALLAMRPRGR